MSDILTWIQAWFVLQCNGVWEHSYGIKIETLDNPGWKVSIDLVGTSLEGRVMDKISVHHTEDDWIIYSVSESQFKGYGGPENLGDILNTFKTWVEAEMG